MQTANQDASGDASEDVNEDATQDASGTASDVLPQTPCAAQYNVCNTVMSAAPILPPEGKTSVGV